MMHTDVVTNFAVTAAPHKRWIDIINYKNFQNSKISCSARPLRYLPKSSLPRKVLRHVNRLCVHMLPGGSRVHPRSKVRTCSKKEQFYWLLHRLRPTAGAGRELSSSPTGDVLGDKWLGDRFMCKVNVGKYFCMIKTTPITVPCS